MTPLRAPDHRLLLPQGTRLVGSTSVARRSLFPPQRAAAIFISASGLTGGDRADPEATVNPKRAGVCRTFAEPAHEKVHVGMLGLTVRRGSHIAMTTKVLLASRSRKLALLRRRYRWPWWQRRVPKSTRTAKYRIASAHRLPRVQSAWPSRSVIGRTSHTGALIVGSLGAARSVYSQFLGKGTDIQLPANTTLLLQFNRVGTTPSRTYILKHQLQSLACKLDYPLSGNSGAKFRVESKMDEILETEEGTLIV
jgi:hypothetical protein